MVMICLFRCLCKQSQLCHFLCKEVRNYGIRAMSKLVLLLLMVEMFGERGNTDVIPLVMVGVVVVRVVATVR